MSSSVNTNIGAMIALQNLNSVNSSLEMTQSRVSTGLRVSRAQDDGAVYAVAQGLRADNRAITAVNEQLGGVQGLVDTTLEAMDGISNVVTGSDDKAGMRETLIRLADENVTGDTRAQYEAQFKSQLESLKSALDDSDYNGRTLINESAGTTSFGTVSVIRNEAGAQYTISSFSGVACIYDQLSGLTGATITATLAVGALSGCLADVESIIGTQMNRFAAASNYIDTQIDYNRAKVDSIERGLGALVDADLAKESANLQSLQIKQQLSTQSLSIANQSPQILLSLFQ